MQKKETIRIRIGFENALYKTGPYYICIQYLLLSNAVLIKIFCSFVKRAIGSGSGIGYTQVRKLRQGLKRNHSKVQTRNKQLKVTCDRGKGM